MRTAIRAQLVASFNEQVVDEMLAAHEDAKQNHYLGGARLTAVEGGRFCEAVFRILEQAISGRFTPIGSRLDTDDIIKKCANVAPAHSNESIRLHIPRALRVIYDIRNKRDVAHLADGIDPNVQDSMIVVAVIDWILAELVRLYHKVTAASAHRIVEDLVSRKAPVIQEFGRHLKVLRSDLSAGDCCIVLLYHRGSAGATFDELMEWVHPKMRTNLKRTLTRLQNDAALVHFDGTSYLITRTGQKEVEDRKLIDGD